MPKARTARNSFTNQMTRTNPTGSINMSGFRKPENSPISIVASSQKLQMKAIVSRANPATPRARQISGERPCVAPGKTPRRPARGWQEKCRRRDRRFEETDDRSCAERGADLHERRSIQAETVRLLDRQFASSRPCDRADLRRRRSCFRRCGPSDALAFVRLGPSQRISTLRPTRRSLVRWAEASTTFSRSWLRCFLHGLWIDLARSRPGVSCAGRVAKDEGVIELDVFDQVARLPRSRLPSRREIRR